MVASDIFGVSGRAMMTALIAGERDPKVLAQMARSRMRTKIGRLEEAFNGHFDDHHRFLLARILYDIDGIDADIAAVDGLGGDTPVRRNRAAENHLQSGNFQNAQRLLDRMIHVVPRGSHGRWR